MDGDDEGKHRPDACLFCLLYCLPIGKLVIYAGSSIIALYAYGYISGR